MSAIAELRDIDYSYDKTGQVLCRNQKGLIFFLQTEPLAPKVEAPRAESRPTPQTPTWQPMEAVEVEVRRAVEPQPIAEATRRVEAVSAEATVAKASPAKTGPLPEAPAPGKAAEKGWFGKLFK